MKKQSMKRFNILLSTYNGENFLSGQLSSLLNQTDPKFIITVRDDGSRDRTVEILQRTADHSEGKLQLLKNENCNAGYPDCF